MFVCEMFVKSYSFHSNLIYISTGVTKGVQGGQLPPPPPPPPPPRWPESNQKKGKGLV